MLYDLSDYRNLGSSYIPQKEAGFTTLPPECDGVYLPLIGDTEFVPRPPLPRDPLTIQIKYFFQDYKTALIFDDWHSCIPPEKRRHITPTRPDILQEMILRTCDESVEFLSVFEFDETGDPCDFAGISYGDDYTGAVDFETYVDLPWFVVGIYAHFAIAELMSIEKRGGSLSSVLAKSLKDEIYTDHYNSVDMKRRLSLSRISRKSERFINPWIDTCVCVKVGAQSFRLGFAVVDTASWGSYKNLLSAADIKSEAKDLISRGNGGDIQRMHEIYVKRPDDFDEYSRGDLRIDEALVKINEMHAQDLEAHGLPVTLRKLTDGAHVADRMTKIFCAKYPTLSGLVDFHVERDREFNGEKLFLLGNSAYMARIQDKEVAKLAKVAGGRCRNNKPTLIEVNAPICDIDISGCYGDGMRAQLLPFGRPETSSLEMSLGDFVEKLVPLFPYGGFVALVSGVLDFEQDLIQSWVNTDELELEDEQEVFDVERGVTKIYSNEVRNGFLTHDVLYAIDAHGKQLRAKFYKSLRVTAWMGYKTSNRFYSEKELLEAMRDHFEDKDFLTNAEIRQPDSTDFYGWIGETIGDFMINDFITTRKRAQKRFGKGTPQDAAAKLNVNTSFGVLASRFFSVGNVLAANNVTARARTLCWMAEKSFDSFHSITDGGGFQLNKVLQSLDGRIFSVYQSVSTYEGKLTHLRRGFLGGEKIKVTYIDGEMHLVVNGRELSKYDSLAHLNKIAWQHISACFPDHPIVTMQSSSLTIDPNTLEAVLVDRRGLYEFEVKDCYTGVILHGSSNYQYKRGDTWVKAKFRSYESNRPYTDMTGGGAFKDKNPVELFFDELKVDPRRVSIQPPFSKTGIIKVSDYKQRFREYNRLGVTVGDSKIVVGAFRPFSTSQFTFKTHAQYEKVDKQVTRDKNRLGWSFERYFLNKDGSLDYREMVETVERMIRAGGVDIIPFLNKTAREIRDLKTLEYPYLKILEDAKNA